MPEHAADMPLQTSQRASFALSCSVARGIVYLSDPAVVFNALQSVERVVQRQHGTFRVTLAPIHVPGVALRPAAEVAFATTDTQVTVRSIGEEPHDLQPGEVAARVVSLLVLTPTAAGCGVQASLRIEASVPGRALPSLVPRIIAQRTAETVLALRIKQEVQAMVRALVQGYGAWEDLEFED